MAAREFRLPDLGEGLTEARVIAWLVSEGDTIGIDQPVAEVETAKAAVEVPSPYAGTVSALHASTGDLIDVGAVLVTITEDAAAGADQAEPFFAEPGLVTAPPPREGEGGSGNVLVGYGTRESGPSRRRGRGNSRRADASASRTTPAPAPRARARTGPASRTTTAVTPATAQAPAAATTRPSARVAVVSPLVRRLARDLGVDLTRLSGTGHNGLIVRRDVERAAAGAAGATAPAGTAAPTTPAVRVEDGDTVVPVSPMQQAAAERFSRSRREIPEATVWVDVDATRLLEVRRLLNRDPDRPPVSIIGLVARFCVAALAAHPQLNSTWDGASGQLVTHRHVNLGVAAQTPRGLVVPVVRNADTLSARGLSEALRALVERARGGSLTPADMTGGSFTLNNYGVFDVDGSAAIINPPEAAIVGLGRIMARPWVVDGAVVARDVTELTLSFDHRVCDGGVAASFLRFIRNCIQEPATLLGEL